METKNELKTLPIGKLLIKFSIPCVLSMLVSSLYNIVDQIFIGQGVGYIGNAATNVVFPFTLIALAFALLIGDGASALFSLLLGKKEIEKANNAIGNGLLLMIIFSVLITGIGFIFEEKILYMLGATQTNFSYAKKYMDVILIGLPFFMVTSSMSAMIRADGSPKYAMFATIIGAILNVILDPIAIFVFDMGITGAALATSVGQIITCIISIAYFRKTKLFKLNKESFKFNKDILKKIFSFGMASLIIQLSIVIVSAVANRMIVKYGSDSVYGADIPLSVVGIVMKIFAIIIAFAVGVAVGGQPIIGYNYGANQIDRVLKTYRLIIIANVVIGLIALITFELFPQYIIKLFGNENDLYNQYAIYCFRIFLSGIVFCCIQKASSIFLQSLGKSWQSILLSFSRDVLFFVPGLLILTPKFGVVGMLWAAPLSDILTFTITIIIIIYQISKIKKVEKSNIIMQ